jgi:hypothetical protein
LRRCAVERLAEHETAILRAMRSVADELRERDREAVLKLAPEERIELALRLGDDDLELFCRFQGLERREAIRLLQRRRQAGRRYSRCMTEIIG